MNPLDAGSVPLHGSSLVFAGLCLVGALLAVSFRNVLHAILALAVTLMGLAALFLYLGSPFVAAMEVVIYVGGISVAMIFAIMFAYSLGIRTEQTRARLGAAIPALAFLTLVISILRDSEFTFAPIGRDWSVEAIGRSLLLEYNLVFETLSVVLLLAIVGAIAIARRDPE